MVIARSLRGMNDLFESDLTSFRTIEHTLQKITHAFGYQEIRTPILEELALFKRGVGEGTDIVEKEMFLVEDGEHTYCLRPENTAPVVRALIERGINDESQEKLYYIGPMFRKERPQKGRLRQFHQFGIELFGVTEPAADVEIMVMVHHLLEALAIPNVTLKLNTLGTHEERITYKSKLRDFFTNQTQLLCEDCRRRLQTNPLRVLDCKNQNCHQVALKAPKIIDGLGQDSRTHFDQVQSGLTEQQVPFVLDNFLVRGLDYYNKTVFEFVADTGLGAQNAIAAGGRYDGLFVTLGNKTDLPAIGCAGGIERIAMLLNQETKSQSVQICLIGADDEGQALAMNLAFGLRKLGVSADFSLVKKSLKAQMRRADRLNAQFVAVIGEQERNNARITIKGLADKTQREVLLSIASIMDFLNS
jgi:histidyl-tRNA synthetase